MPHAPHRTTKARVIGSATPVLIVLYNRLPFAQAQLQRVLIELGCTRVYVAVDGPKKTAEDRVKVQAVRVMVREFQRTHTQLRAVQMSRQNWGCRRGVEKAITWFFNQVPEGIILEDDCVPDPSFFAYAAQLLERYRADDRVAMICGTNPLTQINGTSSYFFSYQTIVWGWASWRRAWTDYEHVSKQGLRLLTEPAIRAALMTRTTSKHIAVIERVLRGTIDTWDYIWYLTTLVTGRLTIIPTRNLVSNVGFAVDATHTKIKTTQARLPVHTMRFPLLHPPAFLPVPDFEKGYLQSIQPWRVAASILGGLMQR